MNRNHIFLLFVHFLCISWINGDPLVQISQGILNGTIKKSRNGNKYSAFLGIRYGKPPVEDLRFRNPLPADNWNGIYKADSFGNVCPQKENEHIIGKEDCLFLNVYTPLLKLNHYSIRDIMLPVMVWIHGGSFLGGSSNDFGAEYILDKNIILVTLNYRLGILGFLSTGDSAASGNFGLKDQVLALKWVQQNIKEFGGDPNKVTLFGQSAGGVSVSLHAISKASDGLFQQYIIQSGNALCPWAYQEKSDLLRYVKSIAILIRCPSNSSQNLINCLRKENMTQLIDASSMFDTMAQLGQLTWTPTDEAEADGAFLTNSPRNLIDNNEMKDLPFISGVATDEGLHITSLLYNNDKMYKLLKNNLNALYAYAGNYHDLNSKKEFVAALNKFYFNSISVSKNEFLKNLTRLISDGFWLYPAVRMLEKVTPHMKSSNYFYSFGYRGTFSVLSKNIGDDRNVGVGHGEDVLYLFPTSPDTLKIKSSNLNYTVKDISVSEFMVDLWTTFAKYGYPTLDNSWKPFTNFNTNYLQIGKIKDNTNFEATLSNNLYKDRMDFWWKNVPT